MDILIVNTSDANKGGRATASLNHPMYLEKKIRFNLNLIKKLRNFGTNAINWPLPTEVPGYGKYYISWLV